jgi:hypothetical protein
MSRAKKIACAVCGAHCIWAEDAWVCTRDACGSEWYPDHGPEYVAPGTKRVECTASGKQRCWHYDEWINSRGKCPDCGRTVAIANMTTLFPRGKVRPHLAPKGVEPGPYQADSKSPLRDGNRS